MEHRHGEEHESDMQDHHGHEMKHKAMGTESHEASEHHDHHRMMMEDFKKRFYISALLTIPIIVLSPAIQNFFGFRFEFSGSLYILFLLSSAVYFYGGYPFLIGMVNEIKQRQPGMMTLIAVAISVAYSTAPQLFLA